MTYSPTNRASGTAEFRKIRVMIGKPDLVANTRTGYYGVERRSPELKPPAPASRNFAFDLTNAAMSKIAYNGIDVTIEPIKKGYELRMPISALTTWTRGEDSEAAEVTVLMVCFDRHNKVLLHRPMEVTIPLTGTRPSNLNVDVPIEAPAGTTRIRFVVRDAVSGKLGTVDRTQ